MTVELTLFQAGYCTHRESMVIRGGRGRAVRFPALFALARHPMAGDLLFDTGYTQRFHAATRRFPFSLYRRLTPVHCGEGDAAAERLRAQGVDPAGIRHVFLSHFHADHIGGARDFPNATFWCSREAWRAVRDRRGFGAARRGFLVDLLPEDFESRLRFLEDLPGTPLAGAFAPFGEGHDLFGDGSLVAVPLPGHALGHMGLLVNGGALSPVFLIGDACWLSRSFRERALPHPLANLIFSDGRAYARSLDKLHALHRDAPEVRILPSHCSEIWAHGDGPVRLGSETEQGA